MMHTTYTKPAGSAQDTPPEKPEGIRTAEIQNHLQQVEELTNDLKRLLVNCENTLQAEGIRDNVEALERWAESYRRGIKAAGKISELGPAWLMDLRGRLRMAADEISRLADEGGIPMTADQARTSEQLLAATGKIDELLPSIEMLVQAPSPASETAADNPEEKELKTHVGQADS